MVSEVLDLDLLQQNAVWFCRLRWIVVALLAAAGCAAGLGLPLDRFGLRLPAAWPLCAASALAVLNVIYTLFLPRRGVRRHATWLKSHVWLQIVIDLAVLTVAIHFIGSVETPAVFMYLFHIILACIFFPPVAESGGGGHVGIALSRVPRPGDPGPGRSRDDALAGRSAGSERVECGFLAACISASPSRSGW